METIDQGKFTCQACGKSYKWKPEFAGRKVKCKCGNVMTAPTAAPRPAPKAAPRAEASDGPDLDALYALADDENAVRKQGAVEVGLSCPSCRCAMEPGAAVCAQCGFNLKMGAKTPTKKGGGGGRGGLPAGVALAGAGAAVGGVGGGGAVASGGPPSAFAAYAPIRKGLEKQEAGPESKMIDWYVPLGLLLFGIVGTFARYMYFEDRMYDFAGALPLVLVDIIGGTIVLILACLVAVKLMDLAFGAPVPALLKIAAIALAPTAVEGFLGHLIGGSTGYWVAAMLAIAVRFAMFFYLFDFDFGEILLLSCLVFLVRMFMIPLLIGLFVVGAVGSGIAGGGKAKLNDDKVVADWMDMHDTPDAQPWLKESANRMFGSIGNEASLAIADFMAQQGCKVKVLPQKSQAFQTWAELPKDAAKRKACFEHWNQVAKTRHFEPKTDDGQKYLLMVFEFYESPADAAQDEKDPGARAPSAGRGMPHLARRSTAKFSDMSLV
jgi:hypothetical protein